MKKQSIFLNSLVILALVLGFIPASAMTTSDARALRMGNVRDIPKFAAAIYESFENLPANWLVGTNTAGAGSRVTRSGTQTLDGLSSAAVFTTNSSARAQVNDVIPGSWASVPSTAPGVFIWQRAFLYVPSATANALTGSEYLDLGGLYASSDSSGFFLRLKASGALYATGPGSSGQAEFNLYGTFPLDQWVEVELGLWSRNSGDLDRAGCFLVNGKFYGWFTNGRSGTNYDRSALGIVSTNSADDLTVYVDNWYKYTTDALPSGTDYRPTANLYTLNYTALQGENVGYHYTTWENGFVLNANYGLNPTVARIQSGFETSRMPDLSNGWTQIVIDWANGQTPPWPPELIDGKFFAPMLAFRKSVELEENLEVVPVYRSNTGTVDLVLESWTLGPIEYATWPIPLDVSGHRVPGRGDIIRARWQEVSATELRVRVDYYDASAGSWTFDAIDYSGVLNNVNGANFLADSYRAVTNTIDSNDYSIRSQTVGTLDTAPLPGNPPVVSSITRANPNPTSAASVGFAVTFSETVTGVGTGDFSLNTSGLTGASVSSVSGSGAGYLVTVNTGAGNGTLRLDVPTTASISDSTGNPLANLPYISGEAYSVHRTVPTVTTTRTPTSLPTLSATPTIMPGSFPSTGILDNFTRTNGGLGANWSGTTSGYAIASNRVDVLGAAADIYWSPASFGTSQEAYVTLSTVDPAATEIDLLLKAQSRTSWGGGLIEVWYNPANARVQVWTYSSAQGWVQRGTNIPVTFANGDRLGARALANGQVEVYKNSTLLGVRDVSAWTYQASGGYIGLWFGNATNAYFDDFGGGNVSAGPTATPTATATPTFTRTATNSPLPSTLTLTNTVIPLTSTFTPTGTAVPPSATSTASRTPTFTPIAGSDLIFRDGFESGSLSAWTTSVTDSGSLSVNASARLIGAQGLSAILNDNNSTYVQDDLPNAEARYRARFYFDPNSIGMANGDAHYLLQGYAGALTAVLRVEFRRSSNLYQIRGQLIKDASTWTSTNWFTISDASHFVEFDWRASSTAAAKNGGLTLWIDGAQKANLTNVDNDTRRIDRVQLGAVTGVDSGTRGVEYFDAFESRRLTYIGADSASPAPSSTVTFTATLAASQTPTRTATFSAGTPSAAVLDNFNRANGVIGLSWSGSTSGYSIASNRLDVGTGGSVFWQSTSYGTSQQAFVTLTTIDSTASEINLLLKAQNNSNWGDGVIEVLYNPAGGYVQVLTFTPAQGWVERGTNIPVTFVNGDQFAARAASNGQVSVYRNGVLLGTRDASAWTFAASGGYIGLWLENAPATLLDDFGGGD